MMWANFRVPIESFLIDESAQGLIEYALMLAIIGIGGLAVLNTLGADVREIFTTLNSELNAAI
jgi:Flp pilus assembly pilin Flp